MLSVNIENPGAACRQAAPGLGLETTRDGDDAIFIELESSLDELDVAMKAGVSPDHVIRMDDDGPSGLPRYLIFVYRRFVLDVWQAMAEEPEEMFIHA